MKKTVIVLCLIFPCALSAQIGIKAGVNFANITNASSVNSSSQSGFHAGLFLAPSTGKSIMGFRTEVLYSKQGYNYKTSTNTGNVNLDYILLPQLTTISITKYFQLQLGAQMAFLLNAKVDSSAPSTGNATADKIMEYYNRFDYGFAGGIEIHPVAGLLIGARLNISLGSLYKQPEAGQSPSFLPKVDVKNNVFQVFAGWTFGKKSSSKSKKKEE
ncbi:MAG: PorT family protein [Chitinophagaceae bacterium]|nr:PorT family protein [Chitinophagaceae bacterium]